ncbi:putative transmembrane protein [Toxoplasma gondii RUB]|uniref:Transmembrane protein n=9 Tax=Toxoplasma gondii TaxID=5811 RepID=A0A125YR91_TOXGV|nr:hypothetical protein TGGT1_284310 [Toxoplasma gondii GT1]ESS28224.1 putative transmembrane protein [Toxoplasma gondii VEG]KAF4643933.1 hypothetical protein TGRH88_026890 [Toxoplasma gondii]KFG63397.1 putative transmembrane protein [Toxoplasma gondii RUB]KFH08206.1 putative transmembrane protein [Toxoplasma gondii VAND]RQX66627.1 putative transmembrane protein [Toxoplasma gondii CAST]
MQRQRAPWRVLALCLSFSVHRLLTMAGGGIPAVIMLSWYFSALGRSVTLFHPFQAVDMLTAAAASTSEITAGDDEPRPSTSQITTGDDEPRPSTSQASGRIGTPRGSPIKEGPLGGDARSDSEDDGGIPSQEEARRQLDQLIRRANSLKATMFHMRRTTDEASRYWSSVEAYVQMRGRKCVSDLVSELLTVLHVLLVQQIRMARHDWSQTFLAA